MTTNGTQVEILTLLHWFSHLRSEAHFIIIEVGMIIFLRLSTLLTIAIVTKP